MAVLACDTGQYVPFVGEMYEIRQVMDLDPGDGFPGVIEISQSHNLGAVCGD